MLSSLTNGSPGLRILRQMPGGDLIPASGDPAWEGLGERLDGLTLTAACYGAVGRASSRS